MNCDRCGRPFRGNAVRYIIRMTITSDVDFELSADLTEEEIRDALEEVWRQVGQETKEALEAEVHQTMVYVVCGICRREIAMDPLGNGGKKPMCVH